MKGLTEGVCVPLHFPGELGVSGGQSSHTAHCGPWVNVVYREDERHAY